MRKSQKYFDPGYFRAPYGWVLGLSFLCAVFYFVALFDASPIAIKEVPSDEVISWYRGLAISLFGSYLVAVLIDRTHRKIEQRERDRMRNTALNQLTNPINSQLSLLCDWYVASLSEEPAIHPQNYRELLEGGYYETVKWLDFSTEYSTAGSTQITWFDYSANTLQASQNNIESVITKYSPLLDSDLVTDFQAVSSSNLSGVIVNLSKQPIVELDKQRGIDRDYTILVGENMEEITNEHMGNILQALSYFEECDSPDLTPISKQGMWRDDIYPKIGDARSEVDIDDSDPMFGVGPGAPPEY